MIEKHEGEWKFKMSRVSEMYEQMGIGKTVYAYGEAVLEKLDTRLREIDETAEYNQLKSSRQCRTAG